MVGKEKEFAEWWKSWLAGRNIVVDNTTSKEQIKPLTKDLALYEGLVAKEQKLLDRKKMEPQAREQLQTVLVINERKVEGLKSDIAELKRHMLQSPNPKFDYRNELARVLKHAKIEKIVVRGKYLHVFTKRLYFGDTTRSPLGKMEIVVWALGTLSNNVLRVWNCEMKKGPNIYPHPNVDSGGGMCIGDYYEGIRDYMRDGELYYLVDLVINILKHSGYDHPYIARRSWKDHKREHAILTPEEKKRRREEGQEKLSGESFEDDRRGEECDSAREEEYDELDVSP